MNQHQTTKPVARDAANDPLTIHNRAIAVDMHADTVQRVLDEQVDLQKQLSDGHFDAVRAKAGGLDAQFFSIWVEPQLFGAGGERAVKRADDQISAIRALAEKHPETWQLSTSAADVRRAVEDGKIAALMPNAIKNNPASSVVIPGDSRPASRSDKCARFSVPATA